MTDLNIYTDPAEKTYLSSPILPILFSMLLAYFIADVFLQTTITGVPFPTYPHLPYRINSLLPCPVDFVRSDGQ
eukprot:1191689-Prorocentrum_minimum.AAC.1